MAKTVGVENLNLEKAEAFGFLCCLWKFTLTVIHLLGFEYFYLGAVNCTDQNAKELQRKVNRSLLMNVLSLIQVDEYLDNFA